MYNFEITEYDKYIYEKELLDFLPQKFIDFHTHIEDENVSNVLEHNGGSSWTDHIKGRSAEGLVNAYQRMFPQNKVTPLLFGGCLKAIKGTNEYVLEKKKHYGYPALYRIDYTMDAEEIEADMKKDGYIGVKPYLSACPEYIPDDEIRIFDFITHKQLEMLDRNGWILMLHIPRPKRFKDPVNIGQLKEIEEKYPNIKLIIAHIGRAYAKEDIGNAFELVGKGKNTYFDFTANLCDDAIKACIEAVGPQKLIFGSDLPIAQMRMYRIVEDGVYYNVVPRGMYGDVDGEPHMRQSDEGKITLMIYEQLLALKRVAAELNLSKKDIEDIMNNNAQRLIDGLK